jgi:hypothetical protein
VTESTWRAKLDEAVEALTELGDQVDEWRPIAEGVLDARDNIEYELQGVCSAIREAAWDIDGYLSEYRHNAIEESMSDVSANIEILQTRGLPYSIVSRVGQDGVDLAEPIDLRELFPIRATSAEAHRADEAAAPSRQSSARVPVPMRGGLFEVAAEGNPAAQDDEDDESLAERIDVDIQLHAESLRASLGMLCEAAEELEGAAASGDVASVITCSAGLTSAEEAARSAYDEWFASVGAMSNVDTSRLGELGQEIDSFVQYLRQT